jgi:hypothetical protein
MYTKIAFIPLFLLLVAFGTTSCKDAGCRNVNSCNYDEDATVDDGSCIEKGQVAFWRDSTGSQFDITVTVNATEARVTSSFVVAPACGASGTANFSLCPGSHHYTAREALPGTKSWSGNVTAKEDGCTTVRLN